MFYFCHLKRNIYLKSQYASLFALHRTKIWPLDLWKDLKTTKTLWKSNQDHKQYLVCLIFHLLMMKNALFMLISLIILFESFAYFVHFNFKFTLLSWIFHYRWAKIEGKVSSLWNTEESSLQRFRMLPNCQP